jgi:glycosyltransferase involved in cell wall biosynthesis
MERKAKVPVLFIAFHHRLDDPRLFHRQIRTLQDAVSQASPFALTVGGLRPFPTYEGPEAAAASPLESRPPPPRRPFVARLARKAWNVLAGPFRQVRHLRAIHSLDPAVIQASDIRELPLGVAARMLTGATLVFDSHEDYFHQIFEFRGRRPIAFLRASAVKLIEVTLIRFADAVFCTDDYLQQEYSRPLYGAPSVTLLRNFPTGPVARESLKYSDSDCLRLVYVGSVNRFRGVSEGADFVRRFNREVGHPRLELTIHARESQLVAELVDGHEVRRGEWLPYDRLMPTLTEYDVGICLWQRLKKFERNLPLKNFDYMAAGLAILTSDFGNLQKYAVESGAAICIDPASYEAFAAAIRRLADPAVRRQLGANGQAYVAETASFEADATTYLDMFARATAQRSAPARRGQNRA